MHGKQDISPQPSRDDSISLTEKISIIRQKKPFFLLEQFSQDARCRNKAMSVADKDVPSAAPRPITSAFNSLPVRAGNGPTLGQSGSVGTVPFGEESTQLAEWLTSTMGIDRFARMNGWAIGTRSPWDDG